MSLFRFIFNLKIFYSKFKDMRSTVYLAENYLRLLKVRVVASVNACTTQAVINAKDVRLDSTGI